MLDTAEIRSEIRRLRRILAVASGNTSELERGIRRHERELRRRARILKGA